MAEVISLSPDAIPDEIEAAPPPPNVGSVTIEGLPGNPGETVNLGPGYEDEDGVEVQELPPPVIPIPGASESE